MAAQRTQKLGVGHGKIRDNGDGTASYFKPFDYPQSFNVRIADITGFAVSGGRMFRILGHGAELASTQTTTNAAIRLEAWFRAHPDFGRGAGPEKVPETAPASPPLDGRLIADELVKLAGLRDAGVITEAEFAAQKARLLG